MIVKLVQEYLLGRVQQLDRFKTDGSYSEEPPLSLHHHLLHSKLSARPQLASDPPHHKGSVPLGKLILGLGVGGDMLDNEVHLHLHETLHDKVDLIRWLAKVVDKLAHID